MKQYLEILVDKQNEKGPAIFNEILVILHKAFGANSSQENFSFEITKVGNRIRFFLICSKKYSNFLKNQIYAHFNNVEIYEISDYLAKVPNDKISVGNISSGKHFLYSLKTFEDPGVSAGKGSEVDPFSSLTGALSKTGKYTLNTFQINFRPIASKKWKKDAKRIIKILTGNYPNFLKNILLHKNYKYVKIILLPFILIGKFIQLLIPRNTEEEKVSPEEDKNALDQNKDIGENPDQIDPKFLTKLSSEGYEVDINIVCAGEDEIEVRSAIQEISSTLSVYTQFGQNSLRLSGISKDITDIERVKNRKLDGRSILSTPELAGLVHLPTNYVKTPYINWVSSRAFEPPSNLPIIDPDLTDDITPETNLTPIGKTNFRGTDMSFGMGPDDRRRHMYIIGKTGMGKSVLLENMIMSDIHKGRGVAVIDPHGDLAEGIIGLIPKKRTNQVIIFDPSDRDWPIAFNMLEDISPEQRPFIASGLVGIFKRIFGESWGPRLEHTLRNAIYALMEYPGTTLLSIPLILTSDVYRNKVVKKITDPVIKKFWTHEYGKATPQQRNETAGPILNKVGQFLSSNILRNVLGQPKNSFNMRWAMDKKKIIIVNLSKGKIGEDASSLLGAMMVTKFQLDAMSRADVAENKREDFYLYVDEFQNFATDSFSTILSEARKYKLNLVMANQYIDQMTETVRGAVFGNVGTLVSFQVGHSDSGILAEAFSGDIEANDLMNQKKYTIYIKQLIDGMPSPIFSAATFAPHPRDPDEFAERYEKILQVSRERYSKPRKLVEEKINKTMLDIEKQEEEWEKKKEEFKLKKEEEKRQKQQERQDAMRKEREKNT
ncbi:type IV secretion system DNA-binding domain-containing protein [Candidatus Gracilibacteria bacterium]|nr:type IV secretion system DNA-binding domain-containing protein [Candidatus Gracilibacteria bacterium]